MEENGKLLFSFPPVFQRISLVTRGMEIEGVGARAPAQQEEGLIDEEVIVWGGEQRHSRCGEKKKYVVPPCRKKDKCVLRTAVETIRAL